MLCRTPPRYKNMRKIICSAYCFFASMMFTCCFSLTVTAQIITPLHENITDTITPKEVTDFGKQRDLIDLVYIVLHKNPDVRLDSAGNKNTHLYFTVAPIVEYTIATGFSPGIAGNVAFMTSVKQKTNTSSFLGALKYTQKKQFLVPIQSSIWTPGNKYNLVGDWRYLNYPQDTYGFGGYTKLADRYIVNYKYLRLYEMVLRNIGRDLYLGMGYMLDYHWNISEQEVQPGRITDFQKYGFSKTSTSSAIAFDLLYDARESSIYPKPGSFYANLQYVPNARLLGDSSNWNSIV